MDVISDREERMMLSILEAETKLAEAHERLWRDRPDEGYEDGPESLADERSFARGYSCGLKHAENLFRQVMNA